MSEPGLLLRAAARLGRIASGGGGGVRRVLERPHRRVAAVGRRTLRLGELLAQPGLQACRRLAAQREPLGGALQPVEGSERGLALARGVGELLLGLLPLLQQRGQLLVGAAAGDRGGVPALLGFGATVGDGCEVELRDTGAQAGDLDRELLGALRRGRLQRERPQPLANLLLDVPRPLHLGRDTGELELGPVPAPLELAQPGGFLDERAAILRPGGEHGVDLALGDDRVHRAAEPDVGEQLDEVEAAHRRLC